MRRPARLDRRLLFWLTTRLYASRTAPVPGPEGPRRIVVVRIDERVGNLVTLQSLLDGLRAGLPGIEIGLLASTRAAQVARRLEGVDHLHEVDKRWFLRKAWRRVVEELTEGFRTELSCPEDLETSSLHQLFGEFPIRRGSF